MLDISPGAASSAPNAFVVAQDAVFFVAADDVHGIELWISVERDTGKRVDAAFPGIPLRVAGPAGKRAEPNHSKVMNMSKRSAACSLVLSWVLSPLAIAQTLDPGFGTLGVVCDSQITVVRGAGMQSDGKIVLVGSKASRLVVRRYLSSGELDPSFGTGGEATWPASGSVGIYGGLVDASDRIVAVGWGFRTTRSTSMLVVRFTAQGALDPSFGTGGITWIEPYSNAQARAVALQPDGKLLVSGNRVGTVPAEDIVVARLDGAGRLDTTFGTGKKKSGIATVTPQAGDYAAARRGLAVVPGNGQIVATEPLLEAQAQVLDRAWLQLILAGTRKR